MSSVLLLGILLVHRCLAAPLAHALRCGPASFALDSVDASPYTRRTKAALISSRNPFGEGA